MGPMGSCVDSGSESTAHSFPHGPPRKVRSPLELARAEGANRTKRAELSHRTVLQTHICASFPSPSALVNTCSSGARQLLRP